MLSKLFHWTLLGVALLVALAAILMVGGVVWLRTPPGHRFVRGQIVERLGGAMTGRVELGEVQGDILSGVTLVDFAMIGADGVALIAADTVQVRYGLRPFFRKEIVIDRVRFVRPEINLVRGEDRRWNFQTIWKERAPRPPGPPGWGSIIDIGTIELVDGVVDLGFAKGGWGRIDWEENRFVDLNGEVELSLHTRDETVRRFVARDLSFRATAPALDVRRVSGTGVVTPDSLAFREIDFVTAGSSIHAEGLLKTGDPAVPDSFALAIRAPRLDLVEVKRFWPEVRLDGVAAYEGRLTGPAGNPTVVVDRGAIDTGRSRLAVEGALSDLARGVRLDLAVQADPLDPADVRLFVPAYPVEQPVTGPIAVEGPYRTLDVEADLTAPAGAFAVEGTVDLSRPVLAYDFTARSRSLAVGRLIGRPGVDLVLTGGYRIAGRGTGPRDLDARVSAELERSRIYRWNVAAMTTSGRLRGRTYVADTVWARLPQTLLRGSGSFGLTRRGAMEAAMDVESEDLGDLWPTLSRFEGVGHASTRLTGVYGDFDVLGDVVAHDVLVEGVEADSFMGTVQVRNVGAAMRLDAEGTVYRMDAFGVFADSAAVGLDYGGGVMLVNATMAHPDDASSVVGATIDFRGPRTALTLERFERTDRSGTWHMAEGGSLAWIDGTVVARDFRIVQDGQTLRADGVFAFHGTSDLTFAAENIDLAEVAPLVGQPSGDWSGRATVRGHLRGTREAPVIEIDGQVSEGAIRGFRFVRIGGRTSYEDQIADVDITVTTPRQGSDLVVQGTVPVDLALVGGVERLPERPVDASVQGVGTDLSLLEAVIPGLTDLSGPVDLKVDVHGTSEAPRFDGEAVVRGGKMTIVATGVTYQDIEGRVAFTNDRITVERLTGTDGDDGRFSISGGIAMENLQLGALDVDLDATELEVMDLARRFVQVNGQLDLTGTTRNPVITGRVQVDEAIYRLPENRGKDIIDLGEAVIYVQIPGERPAEEDEKTPSLWDRTRMNLDVVVTDDAVFTASNARIEIAGDLAVIKPADVRVPSFSGTLQVRRGYYEEFGRRFTIEGGEVYFYGTPDLNPGLHIVATRTVEDVEGVGDVNIRIVVGGTLRSPTIDLESTPPFDKSEIISIALFGSPRTSATQQGQFNEAVQGLVLGTASGELTRALSEELNLDLLEYARFKGEGGDDVNLLRIGKLISPDLYVTFEQQFGGITQESAVGLRYQFSEPFTLQVTAGRQTERFTGGIDLFWEFAY